MTVSQSTPPSTLRSLLHSVHLSIFLYSITAAMFMPVFQSLVYRKACLDLSNVTGIHECGEESRAAAGHEKIQARANWIMLISSAALCVGAMVSSPLLGKLGDHFSHRRALLVPLFGLVVADVLLLMQCLSYQSSTALLILAEAIFGLAGGYMSIFSSSFALIALTFKDDEKARSVSIARLEGAIGLGGVVGLLLSSQLSSLSYTMLFLFSLVVHVLCIATVLLLRDAPRSGGQMKETPFFVSSEFSRPLILLLLAFVASFFAFIGSSHILFYFLKHRFAMSIKTYGVYRAVEKGLSTAAALLLYPILSKRFGIGNCVLALVGMLTRSASMLWYGIAWTEATVFFNLLPTAFSRFASSGLRALMAGQVNSTQQGRLFSLVSVLEAVCNLLAAVFFHSLFPWSLPFCSHLSFLIMAFMIIPPSALLWWHRGSFDVKKEDYVIETSANEKEKLDEDGSNLI